MRTTVNTYQNNIFSGELTSKNSSKKLRTNYIYGFNGQERDDEIKGKGNSYTAEFWQYSPRLGRRWNVDPVFKEYESPYAAFANNPIWFSDPNGADTLLDDNSRAFILDMINPKSDNFNEKFSKDFDVLVNDKSTVYQFEKWDSPKTGNGSILYGSLKGIAKIDGKNILTIGFSLHPDSEDTEHPLQAFFEEFDHALQFKNGRIGFVIDKYGGSHAIGYDYKDEEDNKINRVRYLESFKEGSQYCPLIKGLNSYIIQFQYRSNPPLMFHIMQNYNFNYNDILDQKTPKDILLEDGNEKLKSLYESNSPFILIHD